MAKAKSSQGGRTATATQIRTKARTQAPQTGTRRAKARTLSPFAEVAGWWTILGQKRGRYLDLLSAIREGQKYQKDLANQADVTTGAISSALNEMVNHGFLSIIPAGRGKAYLITPSGEEACVMAQHHREWRESQQPAPADGQRGHG